jgi:hypothetical protein
MRQPGRKPTIYAIKDAQPIESHYFDRKTLRFFGQRMCDFAVTWDDEIGAWASVAPIYDDGGKLRGTSRAWWDAKTLIHKVVRSW